MELSIIGAGFGRTGTRSLKLALEGLGFAPCYHMDAVFEHPEHIALWHGAANGHLPDWASLFGKHRAGVDWPVAFFWRELMDAYPDAKVILTVRDAQSWYDSFYRTIYQVIKKPMSDDPVIVEHQQMSQRLILDRTFGGRFEDRHYAVKVYTRHNDAVQTEVPSDRLLVYEVAQGWSPLCGFWGMSIPQEPFPNSNDRDTFQESHGLVGE
jgi:hypothetical protein